MKKILMILVFSLILIGLLTPSSSPNAQSSQNIEEKRAATYYFYWYRYPDVHFFDPDDSDAMTDHPPDGYLIPPTSYNFENINWHKRELLDLMDAGIEIILPVYWGDDINANQWSVAGMMTLVEAETQLINEGKTPPKIGMSYDTTALQLQNSDVPPDLTTLEGKQMFYKMIDDYFNLIPDHSMWARMDGKPIIYLYVSSYVSDYDQSTFNYVDEQFTINFPGESPYIVKESSWKGITTEGEYTWGAAVFGPNFYGDLAEVGPGFDESAVYGRNPPTYRDRECGEFYQDGWDQVINSSATLTTVETWNEFHEATEVAASKEYGRKFIDLTETNILKWKATNITNQQYVWIDLGRYPYTPGLWAPNEGDGTWKWTYLEGRQAAYPDVNSQPDPSYHIYLNVDDHFIFGQNEIPTHVWVTVEYFDAGMDTWFIEYDSVGPNDIPHVFKQASTVTTQNTRKWKRVTFYLPDAYFANRQQGGLADLRLVNGYDGVTNYFGRVWISKINPASFHAPNLVGLQDLGVVAGKQMDIRITPTDPGGDAVTLTLDRSPSFASLINNQDGSYTMHLEPTEADISSCSYRLRLVASDETNPVMSDAETIAIRFNLKYVMLPLVRR